MLCCCIGKSLYRVYILLKPIAYRCNLVQDTNCGVQSCGTCAVHAALLIEKESFVTITARREEKGERGCVHTVCCVIFCGSVLSRSLFLPNCGYQSESQHMQSRIIYFATTKRKYCRLKGKSKKRRKNGRLLRRCGLEYAWVYAAPFCADRFLYVWVTV